MRDGKIRALGIKNRTPQCCGVLSVPSAGLFTHHGGAAGAQLVVGAVGADVLAVVPAAGALGGLVQGDGDGAGDEAVLALLPLHGPGGDGDLGDDAQGGQIPPGQEGGVGLGHGEGHVGVLGLHEHAGVTGILQGLVHRVAEADQLRPALPGGRVQGEGGVVAGHVVEQDALGVYALGVLHGVPDLVGGEGQDGGDEPGHAVQDVVQGGLGGAALGLGAAVEPVLDDIHVELNQASDQTSAPRKSLKDTEQQLKDVNEQIEKVKDL